jgi:hypothetical protein
MVGSPLKNTISDCRRRLPTPICGVAPPCGGKSATGVASYNFFNRLLGGSGEFALPGGQQRPLLAMQKHSLRLEVGKTAIGAFY